MTQVSHCKSKERGGGIGEGEGDEGGGRESVEMFVLGVGEGRQRG